MDSKTFQLTVVPLYRELFAVAVSLTRNRDVAADIVQETMVKLWNNRARLDSISSPKGFAIATLRNTAIDWLRRQPDEFTLDEAYDTASTAPPPDPDGIAVINNILASLPPTQQRVIELNAFDGHSPAEIALITGLTADNVRQLLSRGRRKIKELYTKLST